MIPKDYHSTFFFSSSLIQLGNIPFCGFSWTPAQHQVQIEKIPLANFSIGRPTVLSTEPLFQARSSDLCPWAHKSGFHFHPQASLRKKLLLCGGWLSRTPSREAPIHLLVWTWAFVREESQRDSLLILPLNVQLSPAQTCNFPPTVVYVQLTLSFGKNFTASYPPWFATERLLGGLPHLGHSTDGSQCYLCHQCSSKDLGAFRNWWVQIRIQFQFQVSTLWLEQSFS